MPRAVSRTKDSAPMVAAALSGLVVGILVTLVVTGALARSGTDKTALPAATVSIPVRPEPSHFAAQVSRLVNKTLGPTPDQKTSRLVGLAPMPAGSLQGAHVDRLDEADFHDLRITFRLNDHPLGPVWRVRAAKADVYRVLKALYTSNLPVYDVLMRGTFLDSRAKPARTGVALVAYMSHGTATHIAWRKLDRVREGMVWRNLTRARIESWFS